MTGSGITLKLVEMAKDDMLNVAMTTVNSELYVRFVWWEVG